jgi:hypothetical protein
MLKPSSADNQYSAGATSIGGGSQMLVNIENATPDGISPRNLGLII